MNHYNPADQVLDLQNFGEFGGVNPSITDSSTFTFLQAETMEELFEIEKEGCYLYSRHTNPSNKYLADALAAMEGTEAAHASASGMGSISSVLMHFCGQGDEIISARTVYGGSYAFMKNFLPRFGVQTHFVDMTNLDAVRSKISDRTKVIYTEAMSNPLLEIADIPSLAKLAKEHNVKLLVDNTFSPMVLSPAIHGADVVVHSLTKFINGTSDAVGGVTCGPKELVAGMMDVNAGSSMLLGPVLDGLRSASMLKNLRSLHIRMKQHSRNALYLAERFEQVGLKVYYPGLQSHPQHELMKSLYNEDFGFGGMLMIDARSHELSYRLMEHMQNSNIGYLAVSLGFSKTLFSNPGGSTSSEFTEEEMKTMGLSDGLVRVSVGLDNDIERTYQKMLESLKAVGLLD